MLMHCIDPLYAIFIVIVCYCYCYCVILPLLLYTLLLLLYVIDIANVFKFIVIVFKLLLFHSILYFSMVIIILTS